MFNKSVTTTSFGQHYVFRLRNSGSLPKSLSSEKFSDIGLALQFIRGLNQPMVNWQRFTHTVSGLSYDGWRTSYPQASIDEFIAECLVRGDIQCFQSKANDTLKSTTAQRQFKTKFGISYHFVPASSLLTSKPNKTESVNSKESAKLLINKLNLTKPQLIELNKALDLPVETDYVKLNESLAKALVDSDVVVCVEEPNLNTASDGDAESEPASNTAADSSPHPEAAAGSKPDADKESEEDEKPVCKLTTLIVTCDHGGRQQKVTSKLGTTPSIGVVASETAKRGFDKIKATVQIDAPCGSHTSSSSSISPTPAKTVKGSLENTYHLACKPVSNPLKYLWLPSIKPTTYKISANACDRFSPAAVEVDVYPKIKWDVKVGYSFGGKESKSEVDWAGDRDMKYEHSNKTGKFTGHVIVNYDEDERKLTADYKVGIDTVLTRLDWIRDKVDSFLKKMGEYGPIKLEVFWPELSITYSTELKEDKSSPEVVSTYDLSINADPLIGLKGSFDAFPLLLAASGVLALERQLRLF